MSYGALSKSTKLAMAIASRLSDTSENTGEGGMSNEQRTEAKQLIYQCLAGRLGWNIHDMQRADGLEIYISQGAKPGLGGQLMAKKVTPEIARIRGIPAGIDLRSPSRHPDVLGADDLVIKVEEFREATGYRKPVSVKLGAGRVRDDIKIAYKDGFDFVELDGMQGSTGAASHEVLEYVGIPTLSAIQEAVDALAEVGGTKDDAARAHGRHQGRHRRREGAGARRARGRGRHRRHHRRRLHRLPAMPCRPVRGRHRHPGSRAREALQHAGRGAQRAPLSRMPALAAGLDRPRPRLQGRA